MNSTEQRPFHRHGMNLLRRALECSVYGLASELDIDPATARSWKRTAERFLNPCDSPAKQQRAITACDQRGHSVERLLMIDTYARKAKARGRAWRIREELCTMPGNFSEVKRRAATLAEEHATAVPPKKGISVTQPKHGMRSLTIRDDARAISDLLLGLDNASAGSREPQSAARLSAFRSFMTPPSPTETHAPLPVPRLRTMVIVGVDDYVKILAGEGDEVQLALSDGTTMTGAEYLTHLVAGRSGCSSERDGSSGDDSTGANDVTFALFHPTEGGVNTYRARFANSKQRDLAVAEHPVCAWPGCSVPGYLCEIHHLTAHKHGGETNPSNLAPLCRYHNGINDDTTSTNDHRGNAEYLVSAANRADNEKPPAAGDAPRGARPRGRMERVHGRVMRRRVDGALRANTHAASRLGAQHLIRGPNHSGWG